MTSHVCLPMLRLVGTEPPEHADPQLFKVHAQGKHGRVAALPWLTMGRFSARGNRGQKISGGRRDGLPVVALWFGSARGRF